MPEMPRSSSGRNVKFNNRYAYPRLPGINPEDYLILQIYSLNEEKIKTKILLLITLTLSGLQASPNAFSIPRTWSNAEGNQIEGTLLSYQAGSVILKRNDGMIFSIPMSSLSERDQGYMESLINSSLTEGYVLDRMVDIEYKIARKYTTEGELVETGKTTALGGKERIRTPVSYYGLIQGTTSKNGYVYVLSKQSYDQLRELQTININSPQSHGFLESNRLTEDDSPINMTGSIVLGAKYGADGSYNDVTAIIQKAINNGERNIQVGNHRMGGDPIFGTSKYLRITLSTPTGAVQRTVREGESLNLR